MTTKSVLPVFPLGLETSDSSKLKGFVNTGIIEHAPGAVMAIPEGEDGVGIPSQIRYNPDTDTYEGYYADGGWLPFGGGGVRWEMLSYNASHTLSAGRGYFFNNTTGASTATLPVVSKVGETVTICDAAGKFSTYPLTIDPNGKGLYGSTEPMVISTDNVAATFTWTGDEMGWVVTAGVGLGQGRVYSREIHTETTTAQTSSITLAYQPEIVDVYLDGKRLSESKYVLNGFSIDFADPIAAGVEVQIIEYTPIQLGNGSNSGSSSQVTWVYNEGSAIGGETTLTVDLAGDDVSEIYVNSARQQKGIGFTFDKDTNVITLAQALEPEDEVIVKIGGDPTLYNQIDRTPNEVARAANVTLSQVILSSNTAAKLDGKTVLYDVAAQKAWGLPSGIPAGATIVSVSGSSLTYAPGNVVVSLIPVAGSADALGQLLASSAGAGNINTTIGVNVQDILAALYQGHPFDSSTITTAYLQGKTLLVLDKEMTIVDTDNQGAKVPSNTTIIDQHPQRHPVKTTKVAQSAFRLDGDNIVIQGLKGIGVATSANTSTSEFITSRMASVVDGKVIKNLNLVDLDIEGFTTGIALSGVDGAIIRNIRGRNFKYSPDGLNSAGGYLIVFGGGTSKNVNIDGIYHKLIAGNDRHTIYLSAMGNEIGWENVICSNITCDWTENSVNNKSTNGSPFAMIPIHARTGNGLIIDGMTVRGYSASVIALENQYGPITNAVINGVNAFDCQSYQNGTIMEIGSIDLGFAAYTPRNQFITVTNINTKIVRGTDNSGAKMPAGSDIGVIGGNIDFLGICGASLTTESGNAVKLTSCNDILIDNITDNLLDQTSGFNSINLVNCSRVTIGNIRSNRNPTTTKERVYTLSDTCTEITCRFPRRVVFLVNAGTITLTEDRWDMLSGAPVANADGKTVNVALRNHVSANAKRTCNVHNLTLANVKGVRVADIDANTLRVGFWDTSTNAQATLATANNIIVIEFTC